MKLRVLVLALAGVMLIAIPARSQVKWGPKVGVLSTDLSVDNDLFSTKNGTGFTAGLTVEAMLPVAGLGIDGSIMYGRYAADFAYDDECQSIDRDYLDIPINLKWKIGVSAIGRFVTPYIFTGPSLSFLCSKKYMFYNLVKCSAVRANWNVGVGVEAFKHVQVAFTYGIALNKTLENIVDQYEGVRFPQFEGKENYWAIRAAYLF